MSVTLFTGGTRSGKSALAVRYAECLAAQRIFVATALVNDEEMALRVQKHQAERGIGWRCVTNPLLDIPTLDQLVCTPAHVLVIDCMTMWLSNCMAQQMPPEAIRERVQQLCAWLRMAPAPVIIVSAEVGMGIVPMEKLSRQFRDLHGEVNQCLAGVCTTVALVACGLPLLLKGALPEEL